MPKNYKHSWREPIRKRKSYLNFKVFRLNKDTFSRVLLRRSDTLHSRSIEQAWILNSLTLQIRKEIRKKTAEIDGGKKIRGISFRHKNEGNKKVSVEPKFRWKSEVVKSVRCMFQVTNNCSNTHDRLAHTTSLLFFFLRQHYFIAIETLSA